MFTKTHTVKILAIFLRYTILFVFYAIPYTALCAAAVHIATHTHIYINMHACVFIHLYVSVCLAV